jgi:hypothetical protein
MQVPDMESTNQNRARSRRPRDLEYETLVVWQKRAIHCGEKRDGEWERERGEDEETRFAKDFPMAAIMVCCSAVLPLSIRIKSCDVEGRVVGWQQMRTSCTFARRNLALRRRAGGNTGVEPDLQEDDYDVHATAGSELRVGLQSPLHKFNVYLFIYFSFPVWKFCLLSPRSCVPLLDHSHRFALLEKYSQE